MTWRHEPSPLPPDPNARILVLRAVCLATQGEAGVLADVLQVIAGAGLLAGDTLALLATLDGEGLVALDEEEDHSAVSLTDAGAVWAGANRRPWHEYG